jgi:hypothetical protein
VAGTVTAAYDHRVQLTPVGNDEGFLASDAITELVKQQHAMLDRVERVIHGSAPYRRGVVLRYNPLATCNPKGATALLARYKYWKDRGLPVSVVWDDERTEETVPDRFEFALEDDTKDIDLSIRCRSSGYFVTLINLRNSPRHVRLRVRIQDQDMDRYETSRLGDNSLVTAERTSGTLSCGLGLSAFGCAVVQLAERSGK